tara:strand:+ start:2690 stop:4045 length:1356 start_codon:yes stop_codon:yes gene_type:complete
MCGIAGAFNGTEATVATMLDRIEHRGPDGRGLSQHDEALHGHVRLSLVDLTDASAQPFHHQGATLTFNGEIWNHREIRQASPTTYKTQGDTEALADLLHRKGIKGLNELDGMFAFAWSCEGQHWLARDPFGKIPLYIAKTKTGYLWASERKAFPRSLKPIAVPPGHAFNLNTGEWFAYYKLPRQAPAEPKSLLGLLEQGVNKRLEADAPVCCLISGGLDSSIILALAKQRSQDVTAFTATFDKDSTDLAAARRLCSDLGVNLIEVPVEISTDLTNQAIKSIEIASKAQIEIAMLCLPLAQRIAAEGFKACLSGEAADELFGGYGNFCIKASKLSGAPLLELRRQQLAKMSRGNFVRCNKAFMAAGVECRLPFMEQQLVEMAVNLDKKDSPLAKGLLKQATEEILPKWIIKRQKETFQGASGVSTAIAAQIASPTIFYNNELRKQFGYLPKD